MYCFKKQKIIQILSLLWMILIFNCCSADEEESTISVYDMRGRIIENFNQINNQEGWHDVVLNADNMSSGIYFYRLASKENIVSQKKMLLMK